MGSCLCPELTLFITKRALLRKFYFPITVDAALFALEFYYPDTGLLDICLMMHSAFLQLEVRVLPMCFICGLPLGSGSWEVLFCLLWWKE